jgi:hypothetical protein
MTMGSWDTAGPCRYYLDKDADISEADSSFVIIHTKIGIYFTIYFR